MFSSLAWLPLFRSSNVVCGHFARPYARVEELNHFITDARYMRCSTHSYSSLTVFNLQKQISWANNGASRCEFKKSAAIAW